MIAKGQKNNLHTPEDVYDLPDAITVHQIGGKYRAVWDDEDKVR